MKRRVDGIHARRVGEAKKTKTINKSSFILNLVSIIALVLAPLAFPVSTNAVHLADGLAGYWNFDDDTATDLAHGNNGTVTGALFSTDVPVVAGNVKSLDFDGSGDYVEVPDSPELDLSSAITVTGWVYLDSFSTQNTVAAKWRDISGANQRGYLLTVALDGTPRFYISTDGVNFPRATGAALSTGAWYHLAGTFDGSDIKIYVDGVLAGTTAQAGSIYLNNEPLLIGANDGYGGTTRKFTDGKVDEVRIYNKDLSSDEVAALADYGNFSVGSLTPEVGYNPVGSEHAVTAMIDPALSYIPVLFDIDGPNSSESDTVSTDGTGVASLTYTGANPGTDTITACVDVNDDGSCSGETSAVSATKYWLKYYFTGGGNVKDGKTLKWTFGGNVGWDENGLPVGQFQIVDHVNKVVCHFNSISSLAFPESDTALFIASGKCNQEPVENMTFTVEDNAEPGAGVDEIDIPDFSGGSTVFSATITGGNFQIHTPEMVLVDTVVVPADDIDGVLSNVTLQSGETYKLKAYGTADACETGCGYSILFDAEYSTSDSGANWVDGVAAPYLGYGVNLLDLQVNGGFVDWDDDAVYNADHTYWTEIAGTGAPVSLQVYDVFYPNNTGSLTVDIFVVLY